MIKKPLLGTVGILCLLGVAVAEPPGPEENDGTATADEAGMGAAGQGAVPEGTSGFAFGAATRPEEDVFTGSAEPAGPPLSTEEERVLIEGGWQ